MIRYGQSGWRDIARRAHGSARFGVRFFTCKTSSHKTLYDFMAGAELECHQEKVRQRRSSETRRYRWIEDVPLRDGKDAIRVNWIGMEIIDAKGRVKFTTAWVTSLPVSKH